MLKVLNVLGYISLVTVYFFVLNFLLSFDFTLQIINILIIIAVICINRFAIKGRKYMGIRILVSLIVITILSRTLYYSYVFISGNVFKNQIEAIYDEKGNEILTGEEVKSYVVKYMPGVFMSKGGEEKGYIRFYNVEEKNEVMIINREPLFSTENKNQLTIIFNNKIYNFR
jgi:hypothetical protein